MLTAIMTGCVKGRNMHAMIANVQYVRFWQCPVLQH